MYQLNKDACGYPNHFYSSISTVSFLWMLFRAATYFVHEEHFLVLRTFNDIYVEWNTFKQEHIFLSSFTFFTLKNAI